MGREGDGGFYSTKAWRKVRERVLERDHRVCQVRGAKCVKHATEVDHIAPLAAGGARLDPSNLRASCKPCNAGRSAGMLQRVLAAGVPDHLGPSRQW